MSNIVYAVFALAIAVIASVWFLKSRKKEPSGESSMETWIPKETSARASQAKNGDPALYELGISHVSDKPIMYALTTCQHCRNTRRYLDEAGAQYTCIYVDEFSHGQRSELMDVVRMYNPRGTFPTILFPNGKVIVGYRRQLLEEALHDSGKTA